MSPDTSPQRTDHRLSVVPAAALATSPQTIADPQERDRLLRNLILPKASPEQLQLVLAICQRYGFDPLLRHVLIVSGNLYVTRDGLRHMAWQSGEFDGYDPVEERQDERGNWIVTVRVYRKGIARPFTATAYQVEAQNTQSPVWRSHPRLMTGKVAEVIALRMAFGVSLGGAEEIGYEASSNQTNIGAVQVIEHRPAIAPPSSSTLPLSAPGLLPGAVPLSSTPAERAKAVFVWLRAEERDLAEQEGALGQLFAITDKFDALTALKATAYKVADQDAVDAAWHDRMAALGADDSGNQREYDCADCGKRMVGRPDHICARCSAPLCAASVEGTHHNDDYLCAHCRMA